MRSTASSRVYWILMILSVAITMAYQIWNLQRPSDEEVQRKMQEGIASKQLMDEERKFQIEQDRIFGTHDATNR